LEVGVRLRRPQRGLEGLDAFSEIFCTIFERFSFQAVYRIVVSTVHRDGVSQ
jgi:hypothetical protein